MAEHFDRLFPRTQQRSSKRSYDAEGWYAGRRAADNAHLQYGGQVTR